MTNTEKENARGVIGAIGSTELNNYYTKTEINNKISSISKVTTITVPTTGWTTSRDTNGVTYYTIKPCVFPNVKKGIMIQNIINLFGLA